MYQEYFFSNNYTESFSRVGTQHQNARAERAIQTIMGMDNSYIIHSIRFRMAHSDVVSRLLKMILYSYWRKSILDTFLQ